MSQFVQHWTDRLLDERARKRFEDWLDGLADEGAEATLNGNPARGLYLNHIAERARGIEHVQNFGYQPFNERAVVAAMAAHAARKAAA